MRAWFRRVDIVFFLWENVETAISASRNSSSRVGVSVWDVRAVSPLDSKMIAAAHNHSLVVTLEDGIVEGGIGSSIANHLRDLNGPAPTIITKGSLFRSLIKETLKIFCLS